MQNLVRGAITSAVATIMLVVFATQASAAWAPLLLVQQVRFTPCNWAYIANGSADTGLLAVMDVSMGSGFVADPTTVATDSGARYGFYALTREAVSTWDKVTAGANYGNAFGLNFTDKVTSRSRIVINQGVPAVDAAKDTDLRGVTYIQRRTSATALDASPGTERCLQLNPPTYRNYDIQKAIIYIKNDSDWFTQYGDSKFGSPTKTTARKEWENCFPRGGPQENRALSEYTCTKINDYGSVITHELGHALGMMHPDPLGTETAAPAVAAECNNYLTKATMCRAVPKGRTGGRVLEISDIDAYNWGLAYRP